MERGMKKLFLCLVSFLYFGQLLALDQQLMELSATLKVLEQKLTGQAPIHVPPFEPPQPGPQPPPPPPPFDDTVVSGNGAKKRPLPPSPYEVFMQQFEAKNNFTQTGLEEGRRYLELLKQSGASKELITQFETMVDEISKTLTKKPIQPIVQLSTADQQLVGEFKTIIGGILGGIQGNQPTEDQLEDLYLAYKDMTVEARRLTINENSDIKKWLESYKKNNGESETLKRWSLYLDQDNYTWPEKKHKE